MSQASQRGRSGAVFPVRLTDEDRATIQQAIQAAHDRDRAEWKARGGLYWTGIPTPLGTFIRDAALREARKVLDAIAADAERAGNTGEVPARRASKSPDAIPAVRKSAGNTARSPARKTRKGARRG
jgi:hypothetical protein